jgi:hypothetical protein
MKISKSQLAVLIESYLLNEAEGSGDKLVDVQKMKGYDEKAGIEYWDKSANAILVYSRKMKGMKFQKGGLGLAPAFKKVKLSKEEDVVVAVCFANACAQFVSDTFGKKIMVGNAWHAHNVDGMIYSAYDGITKKQADKMSEWFSEINKNPIGKTHEKVLRPFVQSLVPDQQQFVDLPLGTVVGLYFDRSSNFTKAFFESGTGRKNMGTGSNSSGGKSKIDGPFFINKETGEPWSQDDLGKDIEYAPDIQYLAKGRGFGMNTHIGFVAAKQDGIPIIYHNVKRFVRATGLEAMNKNGTAIVWAKPPKKLKKYLNTLLF